ncbi:MAG: CoA transferase [Deltaproteobacteria bacterium]|nr:CoA transferase [Deltaproteobacteria bacterium]MBW2359259.1 CoA transferase [Deltaproteobacteria bacterium]
MVRQEQRDFPAGPLSGIRVLDLGTFLAGPWALGILADQGAEVIKVEVPGVGDIVRYFGSERNGIGGLFHSINRGKKSIAVNVKDPRGLEIVLSLARDCDVLLHNYRPGVAERLGLAYADIAAINPGIVYLSLSGFGEVGPYRHKRAYDATVQAYSGYTMSMLDDCGAPVRSFQIVADKVSALTASQAITAALFARQRGAGGQEIKLSMADSCLQFLWLDCQGTVGFLEPGAIEKPLPMQKGILPMQFERGWAHVQPVSDAEFISFCRAFDIDVADDPKLNTIVARNEHPEAVRDILARIDAKAVSMDVDEAIAALEAEDVPCAKAQTLDELMHHPQAEALRSFIVTDHPVAGRMREPRSAARFVGTPNAVPSPSATLGQHTDEVLADLGMSDRRDELRADGVIQ